MAVKVLLNGQEVMTAASMEVSRNAVAQILTTANPLVDGVSAALGNIPNGAVALLENISKGNMGDVITIEEKPQGATSWTKIREATRKNLVNRLTLAINRKDYEVVTFGKDTTKKTAESVPQETGGF